MTSTPFHKKLFYFLIFLLPLNLGKHFVFTFSYVNGLLLDYLVPTIYVQDVLILALLFLWKFKKQTGKKLLDLKTLAPIVFLIASVFSSTLVSAHFYPALYGFLRYLLYFGFFVYILSEFSFDSDFHRIVNLLTISGIFVAVLAIFQAILQHAFFNNYLFFGEQPYGYDTFGIVKRALFSQTYIPPYGLFRHPNILAGYFSVVFFLALSMHKKLCALFLLVILLTLSKPAILFVGIGLVLRVLSLFNTKLFKLVYVLALLATLLFGIFFTYTTQDPSVYRRSSLIYTSYLQISEHFLYGVGLNNFFYYNRTAFLQPVHNIFLLILAEQGFLAFFFFVIMLTNAIFLLIKNLTNVGLTLLLCLFMIIALGSFDHYFVTIHQTFILFVLTLAISLKYNLHK